MSLRDKREPPTFWNGRISTRLQRRKKEKSLGGQRKRERWSGLTVWVEAGLWAGREEPWVRDTSLDTWCDQREPQREDSRQPAEFTVTETQ